MPSSTAKDRTEVIASKCPPDKRSEKMIIYQLFPRIFTNTNSKCKPWGTLKDNGCGKLNDIDSKVLKSLKSLGINTLWFTGIVEHATKTDFSEFGIERDNPNIVKGEAGSAYAIKDYYDVSPALASSVHDRMKEFENLVKRCHTAGLKVIIDFVPNHTARVYHSDSAPEGIKDFGADDDRSKFFSPSNNYYYLPNQLFSPKFALDKETPAYREFPAKATGNDCFSAFCGETDWYETVKLNYGHDYGDGSDHFNPVPDTWLRMLSILRFWASKGVDGFRCDMVFMVPLPFWNWVIPQVKNDYPDVVFIGEIYDIAQYRPFLDYGKFDYLYDKVNLYDTLVGIERHNVSAARLTDCWKAIDGIGDRMLNFLENHDEVRYASTEFSGNALKVIPSLVTSAMMSKGPFMIYYGQELGIDGSDNEGFAGDNNRSTIFDYWSYDKLRRWYDGGNCHSKKLTQEEKQLYAVYKKILNACNELSCVREGHFFDLMYVNLANPLFNPHNHYAWIRHNEKEAYLFIVNFRSGASDLELYIPDLAYDMASLPHGEILTSDFLHGKDLKLVMQRGKPLSLSIGGHDALIIKIR